MTERRRYSTEQRSEAVGLALSVGVKEAGRRLGIPYRTVSHWLARPDAQAAIATTHDAILDTLKVATAEGAASLLAILRNPKAADRDKVRAAEVAIDRYQLLAGAATSRSESFSIHATVQPRDLTAPEKIDARRWLDSVLAMDDDELRQHYAEILPVVIESERMARAFEAGDADAVALLGNGKEPTDVG